MVDYCSVQDVRNALTPDGLASDTGTAAGLDDWQIEDAIHEAMTVVDLHVLPRYTVPLEDADIRGEAIPDTDPVQYLTEVIQVAKSPIRWWTRSVAAYYATLTFRKNKDLAEDDPVRLRYTQVMKMLEAIRSGSMDLVGFPPAEAESNDGITVVNQYEGKLFGPEDFGLYPEGFSPQIFVNGRHW